jgi:hemolysin III
MLPSVPPTLRTWLTAALLIACTGCTAVVDPDLRLRDGGPAYAEDPLPLPTFDQHWVIEPWNTATAALYIVLALWWWWRLRRQGVHDPFLRLALPVLAVGGIGGTLYHATRALHIFLVLDVVPIIVLIFAASIVLWRLLFGARWWFAFAAAVLVLIALRAVAAADPALPANLAIMAGYVTCAALLLVPLAIRLARTAWRGAGQVAIALAAFVVAIVCRTLDPYAGTFLGCGLHTVWHLGGLVAAHALIAYFAAAARPPATPAAAP